MASSVLEGPLGDVRWFAIQWSSLAKVRREARPLRPNAQTSAETTKAKFIDLAKQGRILSMKELNMKKRPRFGLTQSSSEILKSSKRMQEENDDRKNPKPEIEYKLDLKTNVMNRSPSAPHLSAVVDLPMVEGKN